MDKLRTNTFNNCNQETVQTKQALVSLSMSVPFFAYNSVNLNEYTHVHDNEPENKQFKRRTNGPRFEIFFNDIDIDFLMDLKSERKRYKHPSFNELLTIFPEAISIAKRETKKQINETKELLNCLTEIRNKELERIYNEEKPRYHSACIECVDNTIDELRAKYQQVLRILSWRLSSFDKKVIQIGITPNDIARAKAFPMSSLIDIRKDGKALCVWHSERTPSMHYYKKTNNVHCFGCNKSGDTIDVYRIQHGVSFNVAVKALI